MQREWLLRSYQAGDEAGIFDLYRAVYPSVQCDKEQWLRWWHWLYRENPAGDAQIWLAEQDARIVSHYPMIPLKLKLRIMI